MNINYYSGWLKVLANLREAWSKRRYEAHFISKLTDVDAQNNETDTWLDFVRDCGYLNNEKHAQLVNECRKVGNKIGWELKSANQWTVKSGQ